MLKIPGLNVFGADSSGGGKHFERPDPIDQQKEITLGVDEPAFKVFEVDSSRGGKHFERPDPINQQQEKTLGVDEPGLKVFEPDSSRGGKHFERPDPINQQQEKTLGVDEPGLKVFEADSSRGDKHFGIPDPINHQQQKTWGVEGPGLDVLELARHFVRPGSINQMQKTLGVERPGLGVFERPGSAHQQLKTSSGLDGPLELKTAPPITAVIKPMQPPVKIKRSKKRMQWDAIDKSKEKKLIRQSSNESSSDMICRTYIDEPLLINPMNVPDPCIEDREPDTGKKYENPQLVNQQLSSLGLDGANSYIIPFDLNTVVQNRAQADVILDSMKKTGGTSLTTPPGATATVPAKVKRSIKSTNWVVSDQYRKLVDTVESLRKKREDEERIGKLFSRRNENEEDKLASMKSKNRELQDLSKVKFEKPLVFSIEN